MTTTKPLLRGHFHQALFFVFLGACSLLILKSHIQVEYVATIIFSLGALSMFGVSALYHRIHWSTKLRLMMRRLDHSVIYVMIAGTFTPVCLLGLQGESGRNLLIGVWFVASLGILQSLFFVNIPKILSAVLYLFVGFLILPYLNDLIPALGLTNLLLLVFGGVAYTIGAVCYGLKYPVLKPVVFGYHEVFHILVGVGAILHFMVVYHLVN
jgi:hemolysin III